MNQPLSEDSDQTDLPPMSQVNREALTWFTQLRDKPVGVSTWSAFESWCAQNPEHRMAYQRIAQFWESEPFNRALTAADTQAMPNPANWRHFRNNPLLAMAASMLLAVGILTYSDAKISWQADAYTSVGQQQSVHLADGSTALLDTDSALAIHYGKNRREVELLKGRAFFDVQPDKSHPFVVVRAKADIQVVGTRFAVNTEGELPLVVQQGTVRYRQSARQDLTVQAGEHVQLSGTTPSLGLNTAQTNLFDWTQGRLIFRNQPLQAVLQELDRYQPGIIVLSNPKLANLKVTGNYRLEQPGHIITSLVQIAGASLRQLTPYLTLIY